MMVSPIIAELAAQLIASGDAADFAQRQMETANRRQSLAAEAGLPASRADPEGMHLWTSVAPHWRTQDFVAQALQHAVSVSPGTVFAATADHDPLGVRVCLNAEPSEQRLTEALGKLGRLLRGGEGAVRPFI